MSNRRSWSAVPLVAALALPACTGSDGRGLPSGDAGASDDGGPPVAGSKVFDISRVATLSLEVTASDLAILRADADLPMGSDTFTYVSARLTYDGVTLENVGLRVKGNSSRASAAGDAVPFKLDTNRFVDRQKLDGLTKLNLHNNGSQPAKMSEYLSYAAFRDFGLPASRTAWVDVTLNGASLGVYTLVEQVGDSMLSRYYDDGDADLYKPEPPSGYLTYSGDSFADYATADYEGDNDTDHSTFLRLVSTLESSSVSEWDGVIDVGTVLDYLAGNVALGNWDTYVSMGHNYYLFEARPGQMVMLPWDMNLSQGATTAVCPADLRMGVLPGGGLGGGLPPGFGFPDGGGLPPGFGFPDGGGLPPGFGFPDGGLPDFGGGVPGFGGGDAPLHDKLLADPSYLSRYFERLGAFLQGPGSVAALGARIDTARATLGERVTDADVEQLRRAIEQRVAAISAALTVTTSCSVGAGGP